MLVVATFCWLYMQKQHQDQLPMLWPTVCQRLLEGSCPYSTTLKWGTISVLDIISEGKQRVSLRWPSQELRSCGLLAIFPPFFSSYELGSPSLLAWCRPHVYQKPYCSWLAANWFLPLPCRAPLKSLFRSWSPAIQSLCDVVWIRAPALRRACYALVAVWCSWGFEGKSGQMVLRHTHTHEIA